MKLGKYYNNNAKNRYDMGKEKVIKHMKIKVFIEITAPNIFDTIENVTKSLDSSIVDSFYNSTGFENFEITEIECVEDIKKKEQVLNSNVDFDIL
jgi:hypothetical protein